MAPWGTTTGTTGMAARPTVWREARGMRFPGFSLYTLKEGTLDRITPVYVSCTLSSGRSSPKGYPLP